MEPKMQELKKRLREIYDINSTLALLSWDQATYMPSAGAQGRGSMMATLGRIVHEKWTDPRLGQLLDDLSTYEQSLNYESDDASIIRITRREYEQLVNVPSAFMAKFYNHSAQITQAWIEAKAEDNFAKVQPYLEKTVELSRELASFYSGYEHIADPLINKMEYGMKTSVIQELFAQLRERLVPLVEAVTSQPSLDQSCLNQHFPEQKQLQTSQKLMELLGFDTRRGRLDQSPHPFMIKFAQDDVRITTRVNESNLKALFSTMHEIGHAFYEMGLNPAYEGTPLHRGISSGLHESQSRLWENLVGKSRAFWKYFYPELQKVFPTQLGHVSLEEFYRAIHHVKPGLIRVEADELTYNLHVIIRFDLELALLEGKLQVKDLPEAWRSRYQSDLGVSPSDDKNGVLQDIHWYKYHIGGGFQGYTLGNILSAQFFAAAKQAHPELEAEMEHGKFSTLHDWLKENIYQHGKKYTSGEIIEKATGSSLSIEPYMNYLTQKYGEWYSL